MRNTALQLQGIEMEQRKAATIAMKDYNLAMVSHADRQSSGYNPDIGITSNNKLKNNIVDTLK